MSYRLVSHGRPLGRTGAELPGLAAGTRGWHFIPAPAFEAARSTLAELQQATEAMRSAIPAEETLAAIAEDERGDFVSRALITDTRATRFLEVMDAVEALALELRDETDAVVSTRTLGVTELELGPAKFRDVLETIDPESDRQLSATPPFYLLVAGFDES
jgi:ABC-type uncharacterized transport system permease subunit